MNEYDSPKEFLEEQMWFGGLAISIVLVIFMVIYLLVYIDKSRIEEANLKIEKVDGPSSCERYHAPHGMNGPSQKQVVGRGR